MSVESIITENLDIWTSAIKTKSASGRGSSNKRELYGIKKLRELILELAVTGKLIKPDSAGCSAQVALERSISKKCKLISEGKLKKGRAKRNIEEEHFYSYPKHWEAVRLEDLINVINGRAYKKHEMLSKGVPILRVGNLFTSDQWYYSDLNLEPEKYIDNGDLIYAWSASFGPFIWEGGKVIYHYHIWKMDIFCDDSLDKEFSRIFLQAISERIKASGNGIAMIHMTKERMEKVIHPLPPLEEQKQIARKVLELMTLCDQLELQTEASIETHKILVKSLLETLTNAKDADELNESWQRISAHFDVLFTTEDSIDLLKQTILQLAVMGKLVKQDPNDEPASKLLERIAAEKEQLIKDKVYQKSSNRRKEELCTDLPANWVHVQVGDICPSIVPNRDKPKSYTGNIPWVTLPAFPNNSFYLNDKDVELKLTKEELDKYSARLIPPNSVLMSCVGRFGLTAINKVAVSSNQQIHSFVVLNGLLPEYLSIAIKVAGRKLETMATSTTIAYLNKTKCESIVFGLPPSNEQKRIVQKVNELFMLCDNLSRQINFLRANQIRLSESLSRTLV